MLDKKLFFMYNIDKILIFFLWRFIMKPDYVAKKSAFLELDIRLLLLFWLIVPLIMQICKIILAKRTIIEFYPDKIVTKKGFFNIRQTESAFEGISSVSIQQTFWGRIFNYGTVMVDGPHKWLISSFGIAKPRKLIKYLETRMAKK